MTTQQITSSEHSEYEKLTHTIRPEWSRVTQERLENRINEAERHALSGPTVPSFLEKGPLSRLGKLKNLWMKLLDLSFVRPKHSILNLVEAQRSTFRLLLAHRKELIELKVLVETLEEKVTSFSVYLNESTHKTKTAAFLSPVESQAALISRTEKNASTFGKFDEFYLALENRFRGTQEEVMATQKTHLANVEKVLSLTRQQKIVDVGCGRGEWLDLLKNSGAKLYGVDLATAPAQLARAKGHEIFIGDALEYLATFPDHSLSVVTAFHVVEHLPFEILMKFLTLAYRKLEPNGALLLETPNSQNVRVGAHSFYIDPTHSKPIPSELLAFMVEFVGFKELETILLNPAPAEHPLKEYGELEKRFNQMFYCARDYAVMGRKS